MHEQISPTLHSVKVRTEANGRSTKNISSENYGYVMAIANESDQRVHPSWPSVLNNFFIRCCHLEVL